MAPSWSTPSPARVAACRGGSGKGHTASCSGCTDTRLGEYILPMYFFVLPPPATLLLRRPGTGRANGCHADGAVRSLTSPLAPAPAPEGEGGRDPLTEAGEPEKLPRMFASASSDAEVKSEEVNDRTGARAGGWGSVMTPVARRYHPPCGRRRARRAQVRELRSRVRRLHRSRAFRQLCARGTRAWPPWTGA